MVGGQAGCARDRCLRANLCLMSASLSLSWRIAVVVLGLVSTAACSDDSSAEDPNVLPTASASASGTGTSSTTAGGTADGADTTAAPTADTTAGTGPELSFPATYRFDCIDIIEMGDSDGDGAPDGGAIQAMILENTWSSDIDNYKLNVLLTVRARDEAATEATIVIGSGVGMASDGLCAEPSSASAEYTAGFDASAAQWQPSGGDACAEPATGEGFGGTYTLELGPDDDVFIYAEDDDGTVFNCVPGGGAPNAVPLHAIQASVTVDASETVSAGQLTGCLLDSEAQALCSCLGECSGSAHEDCGGCPDGSVPLAVLLGDVGATDNCTAIMGETAYDLTVGFTSRRIDVGEPMTCGG